MSAAFRSIGFYLLATPFVGFMMILMIMMSCERLFVYGTLLQGKKNPLSFFISKHCRIIGQGFFPGELFEVDGYPGAILVPGSENFVYGDILELGEPDNALRKLDHYEMIGPEFSEPYEYSREMVTITLINNDKIPLIPPKTLDCWVYLYNWDTAGLLRITGGDYREFQP